MGKNRLIRLAFMSAALALTVCSCVQEVDVFVVPSDLHIITASLESKPATRTYLDYSEGVYYPYWSATDEIAVYADGINSPDRFSLYEGAGTAKAAFAGRLSGTSKIGFYPYSFITPEGLSDGFLTVEIPAVQNYAEGNIANDTYPMVAVGDGTDMTFRNLCSVLKVSMKGSEIVRSIKFVAHDSWMSVNGKARVSIVDPGNLDLEMTGDGTNEITLQCEYVPLSEDKPTEFFLVVPPGTYRGGFSLEINTFKGTVVKSSRADVTFRRSQFRSVPLFECKTDGEYNADDLPYNMIWYEASGRNALSIRSDRFNRMIVSHTFSNGKGVIEFDGPITEIGDYAFNNRRLLSAIHLPDCVTKLGYGVFADSEISSFRTPAQLTQVGSSCFSYCENLAAFYGKYASSDKKAIVLEDGSMVAYAKAALEERLEIPQGVKNLKSQLFDNCETIREVVLPEGLETIEEYCFSNCSALETVYFPSTLNNVSHNIFNYCNKLREFSGPCALLPDKHSLVQDNRLLAFAGAGVTDYSVPTGVTRIDSGVFMGWEELRSITFVTKLKGTDLPFLSECKNLEFFYGPGATDDHHGLVVGSSFVAATPICSPVFIVPSGSGINYVSYMAFANNESIVNLTIPDEVRNIDSYAFQEMKNLKSIVLPARLSWLGWDAFRGDSALESIYVRAYNPPSFSESDFGFAGHDGLSVYVPRGCENRYKGASGWSNYASYIKGYVYPDLPQPDYYMSTDYSRDGEVRVLQKAEEGSGIDLVFMGDAFSDRQIENGTYSAVIKKMVDAFFGEEPYTTLRPLFNVYEVMVVSATEGYDHDGQALSGWFGNGTAVGGDDEKCFEYAMKAVSEERQERLLIIVAMNNPVYAGTCYMYYPSSGDCGQGLSVAYFPLGTDDEVLAQLVHHEAGGHGFSKLADEYAYDYMGRIPKSEIDNRNSMVPYGWWKNADFTGDPAKVKWKHFLQDERYQFDGLGCFEGAFTYWSGAWRPTDNSIMRYNYGGYNAPSRESIWYRAHKLAFGDSWQYDYEEFVKYDEKNRKTSASAAASASVAAPAKGFTPTAPPVIIPRQRP